MMNIRLSVGDNEQRAFLQFSFDESLEVLLSHVMEIEGGSVQEGFP